MSKIQETMPHPVTDLPILGFNLYIVESQKSIADTAKSKNRFAVMALFFVSGFMYAGLLARLPEMQRIYSVTNGELGAILLCSSFGALGAMLGASRLMQHFGSAKLAMAAATLFCLVIPFMPFIHSVAILIPIFLALGATVGLLDVAMNAEAVRIEQTFEKPLMSSFHAVYSISGAAGAGLSVLATHIYMSLATHFAIVAAISIVALGWAGLMQVRYPLSISSKTQAEKEEVKPNPSVNKIKILKTILPIALIAFCSMGCESALSNWSAIYLNKVMSATDADSTWGFAAFAAAMTIGRLGGDFMLKRFGQRKQLIVSSLLALIGFSIALFSSETLIVLFGFFTVGLGLATIVPTAFSMAGHTEGVAEGVAVSMVSLFGYASFFILPPTLGYLSDAFGMQMVLIIPLGLVVLMSVLVQGLRFKT